MCYDAKSSFMAWIICTFIALVLWIRDGEYDRSLAAFIFIFALIQLLEFLVYKGGNKSMIARLIYVALWLQPFIFIWAVKSYDVCNKYTIWLTILYGLLFLYSIYMATTKLSWGITKGENSHLVWKYSNNKTFLGGLGILYIIGIFLPLLFLVWKSNYSIGLILLLIYAIFSFIYSYYKYHNTGEMASMWCYIAVGFAFLAWFIGIFHKKCSAKID